MLNNQEIRLMAKKQGIRMWAVAKRLGVSEATMTRMLRADLSASDQQRIVTAINDLRKEALVNASK